MRNLLMNNGMLPTSKNHRSGPTASLIAGWKAYIIEDNYLTGSNPTEIFQQSISFHGVLQVHGVWQSESD